MAKEGLYMVDDGQWVEGTLGERERTERMPTQTFLGTLAPMPSPVAIAPPAMIGRKVLGYCTHTSGVRGERGVT